MSASCRFAMAIHILAVLSYKQEEGAISDAIASSVNTNPVVIRRILSALQEAGLVETHKGPGVGSRLLKPAEEITLADVYRAVEDVERFSLPQNEPNKDCPVGKRIQTVLANVFASAQAALERELSKTSLAQVLEQVRRCDVNLPPLEN